MKENTRSIRLYGALGARFGRMFRLVVSSPAEAVRALCIMVPGFERELMQSRERGITFAVFVGKRNIAVDELRCPSGDDEIRIAPVLQGSKRGGIFQTVLGAVMAAAGYAFGWTGGGAIVGSMGLAMMAGGIGQLLAPSPKGLSSNVFDGPVNTEAQGGPVPLLYGEMEIGSAVGSAGIYAEDQL